MNRKRLALLWLFYAAVCAAPFVANHPLPGSAVYSGPGAIVVGVLSGAVWTFATVLILRLSRRLPFRRGQRWKATVAHLAQFVLCVVLNAIAFRVATTVVTGIVPTGSSEAATGYLGSIIMYVAITLVAFILESRERAQTAELQLAQANAAAAEARLHALRAQLQPHFLFNALNTVAMAVRRADRQEALAVVLDLSTLLRTILRRSDTELVRLDEELEFIERYLDIEKIRFRRDLHTEWQIDSHARNAAIPAIILQPLVENALRHGVQKNAQASRIRFSATARNGTLDIAIEDDGPGFAEQWREGVGIANVRNRLALLFAARAHLHIERTQQGASVRLLLPFTELPKDGEVQSTDRR